MSESYVCVRLEAISAATARNQFLHDIREKCPAYLAGPPRVLFRDLRGYHRNRSLGRVEDIEAIRTLHWEIETRRKDQKERFAKGHGRRINRNTRPFVRVLLAFSRQVNDIDVNRVLDAAEDFFLRLASSGDLPLVYYALHQDEKATHFHALLENFDYETNETRYRRLGRAFFSGVQDMAEECFAPLGFRRGIPRELTREKNRSVREAHREERVMREAGQIVLRELRRQEKRALLSKMLEPLVERETKGDGFGGAQ